MCSLVMSLCSRDLRAGDIIKDYYNTLNNSRLTVVKLTQKAWFLDGNMSTCFCNK